MTKAKPKTKGKKKTPAPVKKAVEKPVPAPAKKNTRDVGRFHELKWGGGQITIPKNLVSAIGLENKDKVMISKKGSSIIIEKLNP